MDIGDSLELSNGTRIPRLGLGVWQIPDGKPTLQAVAWALEAGYRHIDTAKLYRNEASVGRAVREGPVARGEIFVTTKLFPTDELWPHRAFESSLARLGLDYVDLYLVHAPVPGLIKRTWREMEAIYASGKARAIGVSNFSVRQLSMVLASAATPPSVNQVRCSPFSFDRQLYALCRAEGVCFEAYSPLTRGERLSDERLRAMSTRYARTPAQLLIRWALQKDMVVIPKSASRERIRQNAEACNFMLDDTDMAELDGFSVAKGV